MSDFRSLLNTFQVATGSSTSSNSTNSRRRTSSSKKNNHEKQNNIHSNDNNHNNHYEHKNQSNIPLSSSIMKGKEEKDEVRIAQKEDIDNLWRITQIQSYTNKLKSNNGAKQQQQQQQPPLHVAICATIVDSLPHEQIWKHWLSSSSSSSSSNQNPTNITASMHIHAKSPHHISSKKSSSWIASKLIPISHNPNWNDYRIIKAMLSLAEYAIQTHPQTTHFMMVTESCIPICTLDTLANVIYQHEDSYNSNNDPCSCSFLDCYGINSPKCTRYDEHECFNKLINNNIPKDVIYKALPGWALFSRHHMDDILHLSYDRLNGKELYPLFRNVWAPEELYFATVLALCGKIDDGSVVKKSLMWSKWDERKKGVDRAHPIVYDGCFSKDLIDDVKSQGFMFMRKFKHEIDIQDWRGIVIGDNEEENRSNRRMKGCRSELSSNHTSNDRKRTKYCGDIYDESFPIKKRSNYIPK